MTLPTWVLRAASKLPDRFTGYFQINFVEGGVGTIKQLETIKPPKDKDFS